MIGSDLPTFDTDVLIIGSGFAGLWAAIAAREAGAERVMLADKGAVGMSSQSRMSAGATIYCLPEDDLDAWLRDVVRAQAGLSRQDLVLDMLATSHSRLQRLEAWGVRYEQSPVGPGYMRLPSRGFRLLQMMVLPRAGKRVGGSAVVTTLRRQTARLRVQRQPRLLVTDLLRDGERVVGALGLDRTTAEPRVLRAGAVVLAAGDCSFRGNYVGTDAATGDAFRLAYDVGARLANMEFLGVNTGSPRYGFEGTGIALRFGGRLLNAKREPFMRDYHPDGDAAEIGHVVRAMALEVRRGNGPPFHLDLTGASRDLLRGAFARFGGFMPLNLARLKEAGNDVFELPQEWVPAVQTLRGGVRTDVACRSDVPGLFAAGMAQALDPGLFNGWSSLRAMWGGERAGREAAAFVSSAGPGGAPEDDVGALAARARAPLRRERGVRPDDVLDALQRTLFPWDVCILKHADRLQRALATVEALRDDAVPALAAPDPHELAKAHETANMVCVAEMFLRASLARTESRGDHHREDHPTTDADGWLRWLRLRRAGNGTMELDDEPVPFERYPVPREEAVS